MKEWRIDAKAWWGNNFKIKIYIDEPTGPKVRDFPVLNFQPVSSISFFQ